MKRFKCLDAVVFPADLRRFFTQIFAENQSAKSAVYSICADQRENQVLQTGKFIIRAHDHTPGNIYIRSMKLNGKTLKEPYIRFNDIVNGGLLELYMTAMPPKQP
ncbi:glycoside hydrolase domain-containing protein [Niabella sp.]|uniref:glycoside hydrolase domain-containing protein n=1 Tax=Niabella sp. TaxID=1962976 RepID=UPI0026398425|nr:glycoside hydrolase domain-containing protein [Niabella sp.]